MKDGLSGGMRGTVEKPWYAAAVEGACGGHVLAAMALTVALLAPAEKGTMAGPAQNPLDL